MLKNVSSTIITTKFEDYKKDRLTLFGVTFFKKRVNSMLNVKVNKVLKCSGRSMSVLQCHLRTIHKISSVKDGILQEKVTYTLQKYVTNLYLLLYHI